jgi:hypothetical protein
VPQALPTLSLSKEKAIANVSYLYDPNYINVKDKEMERKNRRETATGRHE